MDVRSPDWPLRDLVEDVASLVEIPPAPAKAGLVAESVHEKTLAHGVTHSLGFRV